MIEAPKEVARPERPMASAQEAKARFIYGDSASIHGYNKNSKKDGAIMSSNADWKNTKVTRAVTVNAHSDEQVDTREKKY